MDVETRVREIVASILEIPVSKVTLEKRLVDQLGAESIHLAEIAADIENEFKILIDNQDLQRIHSIRDVVDYVALRLSEH
jgi:acyl carrier protein